MNRIFTLVFLGIFSYAISNPAVAVQFKFEGQIITVPDGFEVELVAAPPLVDRPIVADFDERGFLYVADSSGNNDKMEKQVLEPSHRIMRLEDTNGDGKYDKSVVFADKMMFPEGVLCHQGAVYIGAPPSIWKLEDTDGDGVADRRTEWFKQNVLTGCGNDVHGPYLGPDGWIYWCKGAFAKLNLEREGKPPITDRAAHIFRCQLDGKNLESVMSGGMDNPVEVAFTRSGDTIFTTTFYTNPSGGKRDALVHAVYGGVYPKVQDALDGLIRTGDLMPAMTHLGPAAPSGLMRYSSTVFGNDFKENLFSTQFNLHRVQRHVMEPLGATYKTIDSDFFVSDNPDFHPTDVLEDADGSLLILDTGGWYKICCPTSQIAKPEVLGAIYRIRRNGMRKLNDPRGLKISWKEQRPEALIKLLDDERPVVREKAVAQLGSQPKSISPLIEVLKKSPSTEARNNAVWALTRMEDPAARSAVRIALRDSDPLVRQAAIHSVGLHRDGAAIEDLKKQLEGASSSLKRSAATALGRIGLKETVPWLLAAAGTEGDRVLEHSLIFALIEIGDRESVVQGTKEKQSWTRRAALIALDQLGGEGLKPSDILPLVESSEPVLKTTALWIAQRHPEWGSQLHDYFSTQLKREKRSGSEADSLRSQLAQFSSSPPIQELIASKVKEPRTGEETRQLLLAVMAQGSGKTTAESWQPALHDSLNPSNEKTLMLAMAAIRTLPGARTNSVLFNELLLSLARNDRLKSEVRLEALNTLPRLGSLEPDLFDFLKGRLDPKEPLMQRSIAAGLMARAKLTEEQMLALVEVIKSASPLEISKLIPAFDQNTNEAFGLKWIAALKESKGFHGLRAEMIQTRLTKYPPSVQQEGEALIKLLHGDTAAQKAKLDDLQTALQGGDYRRGHLLFNSTKAACATCHPVGYLGGQVGPDLTRIGAIRTERDLLEALVFPSASFARGFESMVVTTRGGEEHSGIIRRETADEVVLVSGPTAEERVARQQISEIRPGSLSIMPEGLDQQFNRQELADLIAFLRSLK